MVKYYRDPIRVRFDGARGNAKRRGIGWGFTFEQWVTWWRASLGLDWEAKRGRKKGQYVMARKGDRGIYEWKNVECITCGQNFDDQAQNGTRKRGRLTDIQVYCIFHDKGLYADIAAAHQISYRMVQRRAYKQVTASF